MRMLVAIANYGPGNRSYLDRLLAEYRRMPVEVSLVVLSNIPKDLGADIEVRLGLPSPNPWSLPFAHRVLFRERLEDYDYFVYSEDDTLLSWPTLQSFIEAREILGENEIAGFLRTEQSPEGALHYSTCHSFFHWIPSNIRRRGENLWARYSNEHSACFVATRMQMQRAIQSGGFPETPHEGRYDLLCTAATDLYTRCGLERLICIDRIADFSLPHLPNKYIGIMGLPAEELQWQVEALHEVYQGNLSAYQLLQPETLLPGCMGSKNYREQPDPTLSEMIDGAKHVLVWGAGDGLFEADLQRRGHTVSVYPLDSIMGECCRRRGLRSIPADGDAIAADRKDFDAVILRDVLHIVDEPLKIVGEVRKLLRPGGKIVVRVPNLNDLPMFKRRVTDPRFRRKWTREQIGATPYTVKSLGELVKRAGFDTVELKSYVPQRFHRHNSVTFGLFSGYFSPGIYLRAKRA